MKEELIQNLEVQIKIQDELLSLKDELINTLKEDSTNLRNHIAELGNIIDSYHAVIAQFKNSVESKNVNYISHYTNYN